MPQKLDISIINQYIANIFQDEFHRYKSWDHCNNAFNRNLDNDSLALHLAFYLASWGMYRGSSGLLQKNHLVHKPAVDILQSKNFADLKCHQQNEVDKPAVTKILLLKEELGKHYAQLAFTKNGKNDTVTPTDTLLSKVMLGSLACVPAFDRFFIAGLKQERFSTPSFGERTLNELFAFIEFNKSELAEAQLLVAKAINAYYPIMKIIDMYFWQIGFNTQN